MQRRQNHLAVTRALEIIGEAANKIPSYEQYKYPNIPWKEMIGMRNKLIHDYAGIDLSVLWKTLKNELPKLKAQIEELTKD